MPKLTRADYVALLPKKKRKMKKRKVLKGGGLNTSALKRNAPFINHLLHSKGKRQKRLIKDMNRNEMNAMREVLDNFLNSKIAVNKSDFKKFSRHKNAIRAFAEPCHNVKRHKRILLQKGGFLPLLAPLIGPLIGPVVGGVIKGIKKAF